MTPPVLNIDANANANTNTAPNPNIPPTLPPRNTPPPPQPNHPPSAPTPTPPAISTTTWESALPAHSSLSPSRLSTLFAHTAVSSSSSNSELKKKAYNLPRQCQGIAFPGWPRQDPREIAEVGRSGALGRNRTQGQGQGVGDGGALAVSGGEVCDGLGAGPAATAAAAAVAGDAVTAGTTQPVSVPEAGKSLRERKGKLREEKKKGWREMRRERITTASITTAAAVEDEDEEADAVEEGGGEGEEVGGDEWDHQDEWEDILDDDDANDSEIPSPAAASRAHSPQAPGVEPSTGTQACPHRQVMSCKACREAEKKLAGSSLGSSVMRLPMILEEDEEDDMGRVGRSRGRGAVRR